MTIPCVITVGVRSLTTGPESLVLVADRPSKSVAVAVRGRGLAALTRRAAGVALATLITERPASAVEVPVIGRQHQIGKLRISILGPQAALTLTAGDAVVRHWNIAHRPELAAAMNRVVTHLTAETAA
ncbi:hypothetical protein [Actinoalloteichus hymeniacidonis]|uniref:Uncharacterized protein n=1 Tax=Actinoalloteichus hymeniacidonis TaxID=340345 RepID=A0AAC9HTH8_9PSEU|nr:hypothetical protein [Actinoalloteichus hymeniacidonis]AOS64641.1 hypothetical protein TL08_19250 [Actinoalloteichus hymeniacidonis]MBB5907285.1 hypothetical protein [Actinoalloteichus hymeniacidonis]